MIIHVVKPGDTLYAIAQANGVTIEQLVYDNGLVHPQRLVVGQSILVQIPAQTYIVQPGDTLLSIARRHQMSMHALLRNNPAVSVSEAIYPGQTLVIRYEGERLGPVEINGYAYPYIDRQLLRRQLPYLTYLSIFAYRFTPEGELIPPDDEALISLALQYRTAPLLVLAGTDAQGQFSPALNDAILNNPQVQDKAIESIVQVLKCKRYYGVDSDLEYVGRDNRDAYTAFLNRLGQRIRDMGKKLFVAVAPKTEAGQVGRLYEGHDYRALGGEADRVLVMTYEWGYLYGPPMAVSPLPQVKQVLDYAVTEIPREKLLMGIPNYGYDWALPFREGDRAEPVGNLDAVNLAWHWQAAIEFDPVSRAPNFHYFDQNRREHVVWFEDARSLEEKYRLLAHYPLRGISIWQIMRYFPQQFLVLNNRFDIQKVLE